jgi:hypothetical protein
MQIIAEKPWSYILFDDAQGWVLTFMIGGVVEVDVCVKLTPEEIQSIKKDKSSIEQIMQNINLDRNSNKSREIIPPIWPVRP